MLIIIVPYHLLDMQAHIRRNEKEKELVAVALWKNCLI